MAATGNVVFAYGTLLNSDIQRAVIGRVIAGEPDRLDGYRKSMLRDGEVEYPNLVPDPAASVTGRILTLTDAELRRTDLYEGSVYRRVEVMPVSGRRAWAYLA